MNNEARAMKTTPLPPDYRIVRGGKPGKYFFYRPAEVLVLNCDERAVEEVLGKRRGNKGIEPSDRTGQRQAIRRANSRPFDVMLFRFNAGANGRARSVKEAIELLHDKGIVAEYNYVSSRSPMRSHAVSYAEPVAPTSLNHLSMSSASAGADPMLIGVLDTGRPVYDAAFRRSFRHGLPTATAARTISPADPASPGSTPASPFDEIDAMFFNRTPPLAGKTTGRGAVRIPDPERDTMVSGSGLLSHPHAGHGVFVSSIIARHAPRVRILAEATMYRDAIADLHEILVDLADAIEEPHNCKLLNMSLGFPTQNDKCPLILERALRHLRALDVLLVASAGNDGRRRKMWPASHKDVVAVAATDENGTPTDWSNHGRWVDACAKGNDVDSNFAFGEWLFPDGSAKHFAGAARWSGTSFAAPLVVACIANEMLDGGGTAPEAWKRLKRRGTRKADNGNRIPKVYGVRIVPQSK